MQTHPSSIRLSSIYLVAANLLPAIGVAFWGWSLYQILLSYWLENIVIGFYTILKIAKATYRYTFIPNGEKLVGPSKIFIIPFFIFHFGLFTYGHGVFIYGLFGSHGLFPSATFQMVPLLITFCLFMVSHGVSFWQNYIKDEEFRRVSPMEMMHSPYSRIAVMHLTVIGGAFVLVALKFSSLSPIVIVLIKTFFDYRLHNRQHKKITLKPA